ncbi:MAG: hypothetical protein LBI01_01620 [Elusimicrobium sp.]|jgi:hypothetical protein|nr:hypothetical protein [Elusimicrobium sp.]
MTEKQKHKKKPRILRRIWIVIKKIIKFFLALTIKTLTFFCLFMVVIAAVSWVMFIKYFNSQEIAQTLVNSLSESLGRPVAVDSIELKFFNYAKINNLIVFDAPESGDKLLEASSVILRYNPLPILDRHLYIEQVSLQDPRIIITRASDGTLNIPEIKRAPAAPKPTDAAGKKPFTVQVDDWEIKNGTFIFKDLGKNVSYSARGLDAVFTQLDFNNPSSFSINFIFRNTWKDKIAETAVRADGRINFAGFNWQKFNLRGVNATLNFFKKPVSMNFDMDNLLTPFFTFTAAVPALNDDDLSLFLNKPLGVNFPQAKVAASTVLKNSYRQLSVSKLTVTAGDIKISGGGNLYFDKTPAQGDFNFKTEMFALDGKEKIYPPVKKFGFGGSAAFNIKGTLAGSQIKLQNVEAQLKGAKAKFGTLNGGFNISGVDGTVYAKDDFAVLGAKLTNGALALGKQNFTEVAGTCEYKKNTFNGFVSSAKVNGVPMKMSTDIINFNNDKTREITTNLYMQNFDVMPFYYTIYDFVLGIAKPSNTSAQQDDGTLGWLHFFKNNIPQFMPNFKGHVAADIFSSPVLSGKNFYVDFDLTGLLPGLEKLNGTIDAQMENGIVYQLEKKADTEKVLGIAFQPFIVMHRMEKAGSFKVGQVLKDVAYSKIALSANFKSGNMDIMNVYSDGKTLGVTATGFVDWNYETLDTTVWTIFKNISGSGALAENLTDASGAPALAFRVSDRMNNPRVEMLKPRTSGEEINKAIKRPLRTDFSDAKNFRPEAVDNAAK